MMLLETNWLIRIKIYSWIAKNTLLPLFKGKNTIKYLATVCKEILTKRMSSSKYLKFIDNWNQWS